METVEKTESSNELVLSEKMEIMQELDVQTSEMRNTDIIQKPQELSLSFLKSATKKLEKIDKMEVLIFAPIYARMVQGDTVEGVFLGFSEIHKKETDGSISFIPVVRWLGLGSQIYQHGGVVLIDAVKNLNLAQGAVIRIKCTFAKQGKASEFSVCVLGSEDDDE